MLGTRSSEIGTSGTPPRSSIARSARTNAIAATGAVISSTMVHSGQPRERPSVSGISSASVAQPSSSVPRRSTGAGSSERVSGIRRAARIRPTIPTGTLTRKIGRQVIPAMLADTSRPPSSWPATTAMPPVAP